jgi:hypothetical protein
MRYSITYKDTQKPQFVDDIGPRTRVYTFSVSFDAQERAFIEEKGLWNTAVIKIGYLTYTYAELAATGTYTDRADFAGDILDGHESMDDSFSRFQRDFEKRVAGWQRSNDEIAERNERERQRQQETEQRRLDRQADQERQAELRRQEREQAAYERQQERERVMEERRAEQERIARERAEEERRLEAQRLAYEARRMIDLPNQINPDDWFSHALLVAAPNSGKTNLMRWRIAQLLPALRAGRASLIVLDPKGVLTHQMLTLARTQGLQDRTVFIDPIDSPVAVDVFDRGDGSARDLNETINRITRVIGTISLATTELQILWLTFALRALFALPDKPSIDSLINVIRRGKDVLPLATLEPRVREYFENDYTPDRNIIARLNQMIGNPIYENLFAPNAEIFDIGRAMQRGSLIVINAQSTDELYGRFWIEQVNKTIDQRLTKIPDPRQRTPTYFMIDEAQIFIKEDHYFADILDRAREAKVGMMIAAQHMDQITSPHVRQSLYNCQLKFISRTNADIHFLSRSMGTTEPAFIQTSPRFQFAFFSPDLSTAERIKVPLVEFASARREDTEFFSKRPTTADPATSVPEERRKEMPSFDIPGLPDPERRKDDQFDTGWTER